MSGHWLTAREILEQFGFDNSALFLWRTKGCAALGGKKLLSKKAIREGKRGCQFEYLYPRKQIEIIAAVPVLTNKPLSDKQGKLWWPASAASVEFGCSLCQLDDWRERFCPWLGRKIHYKRRVVREQDRKQFRWVYFYPEKDLNEIQQYRDEGQNAPQEPWPTTQDLLQRGFSERALKTRRRRGEMATRPGVRVLDNGRAVHVTEWSPGGVEKLQRELGADAFMEAQGFLAGPKATEGPFWFAPRSLARWRGPKEGCTYLGRPLEARKVNRAWYYKLQDLEKIRRLRSVPADAPWEDPSDHSIWLTTRVVEQRHGILEQVLSGIRRLDERVKGRRKGRGGRPRVTPSIRCKEIDRAGRKIAKGKLLVWNQADVLNYVSWRNGHRRHAGQGVASGLTTTDHPSVDESRRPTKAPMPPLHPEPRRKADRKPGRPEQNAEVVEYAFGLLEDRPDLKNKELFRLCKEKFPDHGLFNKSKRPQDAFRAALYNAHKNQPAS